MYIKLCIVLLFASTFINADQSQDIDLQTLQNIFGSAQGHGVVQAVVPEVAASEDNAAFAASAPFSQDIPSNYEEDYFVQSTAEYDSFDLILAKYAASGSADFNFLLSPLGLKLALSILYEAASGHTKTELATVLGFDLDATVVQKKFSAIIASLNAPSTQYTLNLGSRIYLEEYIHPQQRFASIALHNYKTELVRANFSDPTVAANDINKWVSNLTAGLVSGLVNPNELQDVVVMVLNAIYFKGTWFHPFPQAETKDTLFYVLPKSPKTCKFMNVHNKFYYAESTAYDAKILRLPYLGNKFSMYIIVPNALTGLSKVFSSVTAKTLREEIFRLQERTVSVSMPKFTFDYTSVLDSLLQTLGIRQAYEDTASFPGISRGIQLQQHRVKLSKVYQQSGIQVNENGTVAYSATEILLENKFGVGDDVPVEVIADRPFLFLIQDENTRQLLFIGRVVDPLVDDGALKKD